MRRPVPVGILCVLLSSGCSGPTAPQARIEFSRMEVHYSREGGWTDAARLDLYGTAGRVRACRIAHASLDTLSSASDLLSSREWSEIAALFSGFSSLDSEYGPQPWYTDRDLYTVIFVYESRADTVMVHDPESARVPDRLRRILAAMESIWQRTVYPQD